MSAEIRDIVAAARSRLPDLPANYADRAIAQGRTAHEVRAELLIAMSTDYKALSKSNMLAEIAKQGHGSDGAAPKTEAAMTSRASMLAELKRQNMEPVR